MPSVISKSEHTLKGRNLLPLVKKLKEHTNEDKIVLARVNDNVLTDDLSLEEVEKWVTELTGETTQELLELALKENSVENARILLHFCILSANATEVSGQELLPPVADVPLATPVVEPTTVDKDLPITQMEAPKAPTYWEKGELLGVGRFGKVYKCRDIDTDHQFALKLVELFYLNAEMSKEARALANEIKLFSRMKHERIIQYFGCQNDGEVLSIFIEYMPRGSVRDLIDKQGQLEESIVRKCSRQIILGLAYLHRNRIIHRDIKAANLLRGNCDEIKLSDFGVSKRLETICSFTKTTAGTPHWMAPEVVKEETYDYKADIWSLGCTIVEMMSCNPPFHNYKEVCAVIFQIGKCEKPEYELPQSVSNTAKDFLLQTFQRIPADRSSAEDLLKHEFVAEELRIVMFGKTGAGKSALGNSLLHSNPFKSNNYGASVTKHCMSGHRRLDNGKKMVVVDTPGIFDTRKNNIETAKEVVKCIGLSAPGPHIFVFVLKIGRFTPEEMDTIQQLKDLFGENVMNHVIVVFTSKDALDSTIEEHIEHSPDSLGSLVDLCQGRIATINNKAEPTALVKDVEEVLNLIDKIVEKNGGGYYTGEMFKEAEKAYQERLRRLEEEKNKKERELQLKAEKLEQKKQEFNMSKGEHEMELKRKEQELKKDAERKMQELEVKKLENKEKKAALKQKEQEIEQNAKEKMQQIEHENKERKAELQRAEKELIQKERGIENDSKLKMQEIIDALKQEKDKANTAKDEMCRQFEEMNRRMETLGNKNCNMM